jgi:hypothetical protein
MLTGRYVLDCDRPTGGNDYRAMMQPRFQSGNIESNLMLVDTVREIAARRGCAAAQVALAWVLGHGDHVVAIPGTTRLSHLETNLGALDCQLTDEDRASLDVLAGRVKGDRYSPGEMEGINGNGDFEIYVFRIVLHFSRKGFCRLRMRPACPRLQTHQSLHPCRLCLYSKYKNSQKFISLP